MNLFENLQLLHESSINNLQSFKITKESNKIIINEGLKDIINNIKNWFKTNKTNKQIKQIQNKIEADGGDIDAFFNNLVPSSGKASTKAGELIRAVVKIMYRFYNDGDIYFIDYGIETCGSAASYLVDNGFNELVSFAERNNDYFDFEDSNFNNKYEKFLNNLAEKVITVIKEKPELLIKENNEDMHDWPSEDWEEYNPKYQFEVEIPDELQIFIDKGYFDIYDLKDEISTWDNCENAEVEYGTIYINELSHETYKYMIEYFHLWLESYIEDLINEYGNPYEEDEEDY